MTKVGWKILFQAHEKHLDFNRSLTCSPVNDGNLMFYNIDMTPQSFQ